MARTPIPDPFWLFGEAVNRFETCVNSLANQKMSNSQQVAKTLTNVATMAQTVQNMLEKARAAAFLRMDIPSHTELAELAASVQRIEDKLDQLLHALARPTVAAGPARTRQPPAALAAPAPVAATGATLASKKKAPAPALASKTKVAAKRARPRQRREGAQ